MTVACASGTVRLGFAGEFKDPQLRAAAGRIFNLGHQRRPSGCVRPAIADDHGDVLLAVDAISNRAGTGHVIQTGFPKNFAVRLVVGAKVAIERTVEDNAARGGESAGGLRRALAIGPDYFASFEIDGFKAAVLAVAIQTRPDGEADAGRKATALAGSYRDQIHAGFDQRHIEDLGFRIDRARNPALGAARVRADRFRFSIAHNNLHD